MTGDQIRGRLVEHLGLNRDVAEGPDAGAAVLRKLGCIQLDPLDCIGNNAELVWLARTRGVGRSELWRSIWPGDGGPNQGFEHFAKERCLLPAEMYPSYRSRLREVPWWRLTERLKRVSEALLDEVLAEVRLKGPVSDSDLEDRGKVEALNWNGWKGTSRAEKMALEVLWTRGLVVVCGRRGRGKLYDVPERALAAHHGTEAPDEVDRHALVARVNSAGMLPGRGGPHWGFLEGVRASPLPSELVAEGVLDHVVLEGTQRDYFVPAGFFDEPVAESDGRLRILGPLDPLIWDRDLVRYAWGFDYVWEVYKPAEQRKWGWYVVPLLLGERLVGRLQARFDGQDVQVERVWDEGGLDRAALDRALEAHGAALRG